MAHHGNRPSSYLDLDKMYEGNRELPSMIKRLMMWDIIIKKLKQDTPEASAGMLCMVWKGVEQLLQIMTSNTIVLKTKE